MDDEEQIVLNRINVDERPLKRLLKAINQYPSTNNNAALQLEWDLFTLHLNLLKQQTLRIEHEINQLNEENKFTLQQITTLAEGQAVLKHEIDREISRFDQIEEYNRICQEINKLPTTHSSQHEISALQVENTSLSLENENLSLFFADCYRQIESLLGTVAFENAKEQIN